MALPNARNQYLRTQIETASKEQLVVMLFDGIIRFTEQARKAIAEQQIEDSHHALMRAQAIIMELICTIDKEKGGEIANGMMSLHAYAFNCLIVCNMKKDASKIDEVQKIYRELREAWVSAMDSLGISSNAGKPIAAPATSVQPSAAPAPVKPTATTQPAVKPAASPSGSGIMASAVPAPATTGYGMGRTASLGSARPSSPALRSSQVVASSSAPKSAMIGAYGSSGTRNIA